MRLGCSEWLALRRRLCDCFCLDLCNWHGENSVKKQNKWSNLACLSYLQMTKKGLPIPVFFILYSMNFKTCNKLRWSELCIEGRARKGRKVMPDGLKWQCILASDTKRAHWYQNLHCEGFDWYLLREGSISDLKVSTICTYKKGSITLFCIGILNFLVWTRYKNPAQMCVSLFLDLW